MSLTLPPPAAAPAAPGDDRRRDADRVARLSRAAAVTCLLALIALGLAWELWLAPTGQRTLAVKVLPLVLPLAGLLKMRLYTYRWVSLVIWLYFIEGVVRGAGGSGRVALLGWTEVALCLALFTACTTHVRWRLAQAKKAAGARP